MHSTRQCVSYARNNLPRFIRELKEFIRFPSIAGQPRHAEDVRRCAAWLAEHLRTIGWEHVRVMPTSGHPIVYADWLHAPGAPTLLIYGHYDVQPADPPHEWETPPFGPTVRGQDLYGRGASDDKGQMFAHVKGLECYLRTRGELPINVRCLFEGEEEIGSPGLPGFLDRHGEALAADVAVVSDMWMLAPDRPALTYALRGVLALELEVTGPGRDLHSGNFGGTVHNPLQALCEIIAGLHDRTGRITVPGFYDDVRPPTDGERSYMATVGLSDREILDDAQVESDWGEREYSLYERATIRPALTVNGLTGGYQGPGPKGVIPTRARAKLSFRLVPDQDPHAIDRLFREHIARIAPATVTTSVRTFVAAKPVRVDHRHPAMRAAARACRRGFGASPVLLRSGGTIPVVDLLQEKLGLPAVLMGFGLPDDAVHGPNEKFHLPNFFNGMATSIHFLTELAGWRPEQQMPVERLLKTAPREGATARRSSYSGLERHTVEAT